ncbi:MAG: hypothetical protein HS126_40155 [Anaerolineales bacterium]|nr:hypothetical protein [Anaerolineales bacterium]
MSEQPTVEVAHEAPDPGLAAPAAVASELPSLVRWYNSEPAPFLIGGWI